MDSYEIIASNGERIGVEAEGYNIEYDEELRENVLRLEPYSSYSDDEKQGEFINPIGIHRMDYEPEEEENE